MPATIRHPKHRAAAVLLAHAGLYFLGGCIIGLVALTIGLLFPAICPPGMC